MLKIKFPVDLGVAVKLLLYLRYVRMTGQFAGQVSSTSDQHEAAPKSCAVHTWGHRIPAQFCPRDMSRTQNFPKICVARD